MKTDIQTYEIFKLLSLNQRKILTIVIAHYGLKWTDECE